MYAQHHSVVPEGDLLKILLSEVKRVSGEYTTAVTEANCSVVRQMFSELLNDSLTEQQQLYQILNNEGQYQTGSQATQTDIQKEIQQSQQRRQQTMQIMEHQRQMSTQMGQGQMGQGMTNTQHQMMPGSDIPGQ